MRLSSGSQSSTSMLLVKTMVTRMKVMGREMKMMEEEMKPEPKQGVAQKRRMKRETVRSRGWVVRVQEVMLKMTTMVVKKKRREKKKTKRREEMRKGQMATTQETRQDRVKRVKRNASERSVCERA
jgi:hypothetical protein